MTAFFEFLGKILTSYVFWIGATFVTGLLQSNILLQIIKFISNCR